MKGQGTKDLNICQVSSVNEVWRKIYRKATKREMMEMSNRKIHCIHLFIPASKATYVNHREYKMIRPLKLRLNG